MCLVLSVNHLQIPVSLNWLWLTFLIGFILDSMINSYLHSSHFLVSELLIHLWRQLWCTYCKEPEHTHGEMRGWSGSASQWHILHISIEDAMEVTDRLFLAVGFGLSLVFSVVGVVTCPSEDFGLEFCKKYACNYRCMWKFYSQECLKSKFKTNPKFHLVKYLNVNSTMWKYYWRGFIWMVTS